MASNALYNIFASKCFSLAHTMVIHSDLLARSQNTILEQKGFRINHNNPSTWKYYLNLTGVYHEYDKQLIAELNGDGHPYMRIKVAGDKQPIIVDFTKDLVSGLAGDYSLAAEYSYGSEYYNELVKRYPGFEALILGILNPIDLEVAINANDGDILYCGGYYRKRLPGLKELYGFERREDVKIDAEFLIEEWEENIIFDLQDYIKIYLKKWIVPDFQANHTFYSSVMWVGLLGGLITEIHRLRISNKFTYSSHSYHVREFINSFGYLGKYVDALSREQAMYLYQNMRWLTTNKGKDKVLNALVENLLTPAGIPLVAYNLGHDTWDMQASGMINPKIEFKKEYLNLDPLTNDNGITALEVIRKEEKSARDNGQFVNDQALTVEQNAQYSKFNSLKTKILESDYVEVDNNVFFNLEEFQYYQWIYAVSKGTYKGSIFVGHPVTGGRLQLTPLTALVLLMYSYCKGYLGVELERVPPFVIKNIPKYKAFDEANSTPYPSNIDLWDNVSSDQVTQAKINRIANFPQPNHNFTSTTDFNQKTLQMFQVLEDRRAYAASEEDIFANAELELIVAKFYHHSLEIPALIDTTYKEWLNNIGVDVSKLNANALRALADELLLAGIGTSNNIEKSTERMHEAIINIVKFFLSYTVQLIAKFTKSGSRTYGLKTIRISVRSEETIGIANWALDDLTIIKADGSSTDSWQYMINQFIIAEPEQYVVGEAKVELIPMVVDQAVEINHIGFIDLAGFTMLSPDPNNQAYAYADPEVVHRQLITGRSLPDYVDVSGQVLGFSMKPLGIEFVDTHGLKPLQQNDFDFTIEFKE